MTAMFLYKLVQWMETWPIMPRQWWSFTNTHCPVTTSYGSQLYFFNSRCGILLYDELGVGANDLANVMSTTMGSKAVTVKQAILIAIVFEFAGAF